MRKRLLLMLSALLCAAVCMLCACSSAGNGAVGTAGDADTTAPVEDADTTVPAGNTGTAAPDGDTDAVVPGESTEPPATDGIRLRFDWDGQTVYGTLDNNSVSRDLLSRLPLTLTFSDYNGTEKIAYLPDGSPAWDTSDAPDSCTPAAGTIAMYAPWGNLCVFYRAFRLSSGLVPLGRLDADGARMFATMTGDFTVTVSLAEDALANGVN